MTIQTTAEAWAARTADQKIVFLQSERRDLLAQMRRQIHTARGDGGITRRINQIDAQLKELERQKGDADQVETRR